MRKFRILCISLLVVFFSGMAQRLVVDSLYGYRMGEGIARHSMSRDLVEDTHVSLDVKLDEFSRIEPNAVNGFTGDSVIVIPERVSVAAFAETGSAGCRSDMVLGIVSGILNFLLLGIFFVMTVYFVKIIVAFSRDEVFDKRIIRWISIIGWCFIVTAVSNTVWQLLRIHHAEMTIALDNMSFSYSHSIDWHSLTSGLIVLLLNEILRIATGYKEEQDLTI